MRVNRGYADPTKFSLLVISMLLGLTFLLSPYVAHAQTDDKTTEGFSLQVSPSPLIATVKPGTTTSLDLQIRNTNSKPQTLKMGLRSFKVNATTGQVQLDSDEPADVKQFVSFGNPTFSVDAGEIFTERIRIATPASAGFTYSFAITVSQAKPAAAQNGKTALQGTVAVFTLLSVDKPGATRKLELGQLSVSKHVYEYLPATISLKLRNAGNTLVQPKGTIYIQRHSGDTQPLASIQLNKSGGYILPNTTRTLEVSWNDGYPHFVSKDTGNGQKSQKLSWQGTDLSKLRVGRYVAKVVAVYDDGGRDVPLTSEITFWVVPWKILLGLLFLLTLVLIGAVTTIRKSIRTVQTKKKPAAKHEKPSV